MADLQGGGGGPQTSNGNISSPRRPTAAPAPTSSPSGIRGPRVIMQERAAREAARQRAEQEQLQAERNRAEQEARLLEEAQRRNMERRAAAAAGAAAGGQGGAQDQPPVNPTSRRTGGTDAPQTRPAQGSSRVTQNNPSQQQQQQPTNTRPARTSASQGQTQRQEYASIPPPASQPAIDLGGQGSETPAAGTGTRVRNSFPHAFERWETLSAHWEGLTNFWIRRLEQNNEDIGRDPVNAALSRQVTDLSAAGANLFHAVVELQRLRASSERKFQRWFFETRAELERSQEVNAMLQHALDEERAARKAAIRAANEGASALAEKKYKEAQKELQISKEEARRAWEELGRREQEERERTISLQSGQPTIVGGVQVVPMTQGVPTRHGSHREHSRYDSGQQSGYGDYTQAPAVQPTAATSSGGQYYQQQPADNLHEGVSYTGGGSEGGYSEEDYETPVTHPPSAGYSQPPNSSASGPYYQQQAQAQARAQQAQQGQQPQDYSGQGYAAPGWETVPRHHHPTRLSDVIEEEDERSRTSASQVSRG